MWWGRPGVSSHTSQHITTDILVRWYTVMHSDTQWYEAGWIKTFCKCQEILRCFPVATCFSLSQTFTIMAYSSGATLSEFHTGTIGYTWYHLVILRFTYIYALWGICRVHFHTNVPTQLCISHISHISDASFLEMFEPFRLRHETRFAVRSAGWRTQPLAALQLWVFGCQSVSNLRSEI